MADIDHMGRCGELYLGTHKALRALLGDTLALVGRTDPQQPAELCLALTQVGELAVLLELSLDFDTVHLRAALDGCGLAGDAAAAGAARRLAVLDALRGQCRALELAAPQRREDMLARLYAALASLAGEGMAWMRCNESLLTQALAAGLEAPRLAALERDLLASMSPEKLRCWMYWLMPALNGGERASVLALIGAQLPAARFNGLLCMLEDVLPADAYRRLRRQAAPCAATPYPGWLV